MNIIDQKKALNILSEGNVLCTPTDTVYGLACDASNPSAIEKLYILKNREKHLPLVIQYASIERMAPDVVWDSLAERCAAYFWPGPLTLVLKRSSMCSVIHTATRGYMSIAVRISAHSGIQDLLSEYPYPLAITSANMSTYPSSVSIQQVIDYFGRDFPILQECGKTKFLLSKFAMRTIESYAMKGCNMTNTMQYRTESTILDVRNHSPIIKRLRSITQEHLEQVLKIPVCIDIKQ